MRPGWSTALTTAPGSAAGVESRLPPGSNFPKDVAARFALQIVRHFPGHQTRKTTGPVFFAICDQDTVAPPKPTRRHAAKTPRAEIKYYGAGHDDIYVSDALARNVTDQLDFLSRHVPVEA